MSPRRGDMVQRTRGLTVLSLSEAQHCQVRLHQALKFTPATVVAKIAAYSPAGKVTLVVGLTSGAPSSRVMTLWAVRMMSRYERAGLPST